MAEWRDAVGGARDRADAAGGIRERSRGSTWFATRSRGESTGPKGGYVRGVRSLPPQVPEEEQSHGALEATQAQVRGLSEDLQSTALPDLAR